MNHIVLAGIVRGAGMATSTDKPCCRATMTFEPLQDGQPSSVLELVAWGKGAENLATPPAAFTIVEGRLTLVRSGDQQPVPTIEVSRLHHAGDGAVDGALALNSISLVGRAGRDPDCRYFESGSVEIGRAHV